MRSQGCMFMTPCATRRIRGISLWDMLYVSQSSMAQFKATVTDGFSRIWEEVRKQKDELMAKLGVVGNK